MEAEWYFTASRQGAHGKIFVAHSSLSKVTEIALS